MSDTLRIDPGTISSIRDEGKLDSLRMMSFRGGKKLDDSKMKEIANDFEAMVFRQLLKEMRKTIPKDGILGSSFATDMYTDIVDDHLAKQLAETSDLGIDRLIYDELKMKESSESRREEKTGDDAFIQLKNGNNTKEDFIPLKPSTEDFMKLNEGPRMIDLPKAENPMMPLGSRSRVSTSRIDNSRG